MTYMNIEVHSSKMSSGEVLRLNALAGENDALQDQRTVTVAQAMELVARNIEHGNRQVIEDLHKIEGTA